MRILVVANLPPWVLGGAEHQVARLLSRISRDFDVIYCRGLGDSTISVCLAKALGWVRLPLVACPINARGTGDAHFLRSIPGWRWIVGVVNRHCGAINLIAPAIEPDLVEIGIVGPRLSRVPNGVALAPPMPRDSVAPIRRLVWTGRLSPQKGLDLLLSALARVVASGRDFHLDIVGEGPERSTLVAQSRQLGLDRRVFFAGAIRRGEVRERLGAADAFVLPSRYEGMSNAALEAMEAGLPLLVTRCGGIDTYVDASVGWVCEPEDQDSLFAALCCRLDTPEPELLAMGRRVRILVEREFEIGAVGRRNAMLLAEVVASHGSRV